jgi:myo-inositol-1(or 4)-monophosphatase
LDLAYVAWGRYDFYYEKTLNAWDVAAGALLIKEAGGIVTDVNGGNEFLFTGNILGSSSSLHSTALKILRECEFGLN